MCIRCGDLHKKTILKSLKNTMNSCSEQKIHRKLIESTSDSRQQRGDTPCRQPGPDADPAEQTSSADKKQAKGRASPLSCAPRAYSTQVHRAEGGIQIRVVLQHQPAKHVLPRVALSTVDAVTVHRIIISTTVSRHGVHNTLSVFQAQQITRAIPQSQVRTRYLERRM